MISAILGALWGSAAYALLWGQTSVQLTRPFVNSLPGLASLFPVRVVLFGIHLAEDRIVGHAFDFSRNNAWIGLLAAAVGTALLCLVVLLARAAVAATRSRRTVGISPRAPRS